MGSTKTRASQRRTRRKPRGKPRSTRPVRGGWKSFLRIWIGILALLLLFWVGFTLWPRQPIQEPPPSARGTQPRVSPSKMVITLYFSDDQAEYLVGEPRAISRVEPPSGMAHAVVEELIRGPKTGLRPTLPQGTRLHRVSVEEDGLCTVDLSKELVSNHPGGSSGELMTVYSIVESLIANIPQVRAVQILVDGKRTETLAGHLYVGGPLARDPSHIRSSPSQPRNKRTSLTLVEVMA